MAKIDFRVVVIAVACRVIVGVGFIVTVQIIADHGGCGSEQQTVIIRIGEADFIAIAILVDSIAHFIVGIGVNGAVGVVAVSLGWGKSISILIDFFVLVGFRVDFFEFIFEGEIFAITTCQHNAQKAKPTQHTQPGEEQFKHNDCGQLAKGLFVLVSGIRSSEEYFW